jgi:hypothetical protein
MTVSNSVMKLHVSIVACPLKSGVQEKTCSGAFTLPAPHDPLSKLAPLVKPLTMPPGGGMFDDEVGGTHVHGCPEVESGS